MCVCKKALVRQPVRTGWMGSCPPVVFVHTHTKDPLCFKRNNQAFQGECRRGIEQARCGLEQRQSRIGVCHLCFSQRCDGRHTISSTFLLLPRLLFSVAVGGSFLSNSLSQPCMYCKVDTTRVTWWRSLLIFSLQWTLEVLRSKHHTAKTNFSYGCIYKNWI